ncbi:hypothetical protein EDB81DRAFT_104167 [Dactylonectria macrodidyma]|uniref:Secreted protein n=1 Tax=Dactylonectria macrodidyma TaxID=307937 RepID=A0A9P9E9H9_9HYPO|nr:hypothetical protein EDB81DRAFT_104167 [Dactylonectria macrodidyma]
MASWLLAWALAWYPPWRCPCAPVHHPRAPYCSGRVSPAGKQSGEWPSLHFVPAQWRSVSFQLLLDFARWTAFASLRIAYPVHLTRQLLPCLTSTHDNDDSEHPP